MPGDFAQPTRPSTIFWEPAPKLAVEGSSPWRSWPIGSQERDDETVAIQRVLEGDTQAFRLLVNRWEGPLLAFVGSFLHRSEDREDAAQEAFLAAYVRLGDYAPNRGRFSTWLFRIARNNCLNRLGREARQPVSGSDLTQTTDNRLPEHHAAGQDLLSRLDAALAALPLEQRTAFVLARFVRLPYEQIARIEGVAPGTVKSRVARAREALRLRLPNPSEVFP